MFTDLIMRLLIRSQNGRRDDVPLPKAELDTPQQGCTCSPECKFRGRFNNDHVMNEYYFSHIYVMQTMDPPAREHAMLGVVHGLFNIEVAEAAGSREGACEP